MNQSAHQSPQDNQDKKQLAAGEFVYEFFQPVFQSPLHYEFSNGQAEIAPAPAPVQALCVQNTDMPPAAVDAVSAEAPILPAAISSLIESAFCADAPATPAQSTAAATAEKQAIDDCGAVISYGKWNIKPHRIRYPDRSIAEFAYDESERLVQVKDRDGIEWVRITQPDHNNISTWKSAEGQTCEMSMVVIPDGTYQCISSAGVIQTCTLTGRIIVWTPFTTGFDLKRTLFAIFRRIDKNQDSSLSQEELDLASRQIWEDSDAIQLISMMQAHFQAICAGRRHALCRQGTGITIDDILAFDAATASEQESRCCAPPHAVTMVRTLFDELDTASEGAINIHQVRNAYDRRHERDSVSGAILQTLHEELKRVYDASNNAFSAKASNLTRSDLVQHYKDGYKREIRGQIKIAGWGTDECWQTGETSTRTLYVDPAKPIESILPEALKHSQADPSMGNFMAIFEALVVQCPHLIVRMVGSTGDGRYTVSFPGQPRKPITVDAPKSSTLAQYIHGSKYGYWMAVVEDAYRHYLADYDGMPERDHIDSVERICRLLNGQNGRWINTNDMQLSDLANSLRDAFKQRRLMVATGAINSPRAAGERRISQNSVCGIIAFDHRNGRVTVNDPLWDGRAAQSKEPSNRNPDGSTTLSVSAFAAAFDKIYLEDWLPADDMLQK